MPDPGLPGVAFTEISPDQLTLNTLRNFDTLVLAQQCDIGDWPDALHCDINMWVAVGGKLIIYDSDECGQTVDYSWLPHPFATNNPGARRRCKATSRSVGTGYHGGRHPRLARLH